MPGTSVRRGLGARACKPRAAAIIVTAAARFCREAGLGTCGTRLPEVPTVSEVPEQPRRSESARSRVRAHGAWLLLAPLVGARVPGLGGFGAGGGSYAGACEQKDCAPSKSAALKSGMCSGSVGGSEIECSCA